MAELQHSDVAPSVMDELPPLIAGPPSWAAAVEIAWAEYCDVVAYELLSAGGSSLPAAVADFDLHCDVLPLFEYYLQRHLLLKDLELLAQELESPSMMP